MNSKHEKIVLVIIVILAFAILTRKPPSFEAGVAVTLV